MIVRNEAHQLSDCLDSVADLFDEIVIVDTGSSDDTRQVASHYTPHVFDFPWRDDFSAARNESLRHAHGDWIFWLDADDRLTPDNASRLRQLLDGLDLAPAVYFLDTICRTTTTNEVERRLSHRRLFRRHPELAWRRRVHEQLDPWPESLGYAVNFSDVQIDHLGYRDAALTERKGRRNLRLLQMEYAIDPDDPETLLDLGVAYTRKGTTRQARSCFDRLEATAPRQLIEQSRVFAWRAELAMQEGRFSEAVRIAADGRKRFPQDAHLAYVQAEALYDLGQYRAAGEVLATIPMQEPKRRLSFGEPNDIRQRLAPLALGEVLRMQREYDAAEKVLRDVADRYPNDGVPWQFLGRVFVDTGEQDKFQSVCARVEACERGQVYAGLLRVAWEMIRGDVESAERLIDELIGQAPDMPLVRVMRADCLERRGAPVAARIKAYRDVLRLQPGQPRAVGMLQQLGAMSQPAAPAVYTPATQNAVYYVGAV